MGGCYELALPLAQSCLGCAPGFWPCNMVLAVVLAHLGRTVEAAAVLCECQRQCGSGAPRAHLDHGDTAPGPEFDRMRDGLRLAGLADG